jgi:hypothetical protein
MIHDLNSGFGRSRADALRSETWRRGGRAPRPMPQPQRGSSPLPPTTAKD